MKRIGIFGGTFNPIHIGHLVLAQTVYEQCKLDKIIFVPSNLPPLRKIKQLASAKDRYNMVKLAIKGNSDFVLSDFEIKREGKSYSIDTLEHFKDIYSKGTKLFFIIGGDNFAELRLWRDIDNIKKIVTFIVVNRPGSVVRSSRAKHVLVAMPGIGVAASHLRKKIKKEQSIKYLAPNSVAQYIHSHKLYIK